MNKGDLKCAMTVIQPYKSPEQAEIDMMFNIAIMTTKQRPHSLPELSFQQFVLLVDL